MRSVTKPATPAQDDYRLHFAHCFECQMSNCSEGKRLAEAARVEREKAS